jgi:hypothetical protein
VTGHEWPRRSTFACQTSCRLLAYDLPSTAYSHNQTQTAGNVAGRSANAHCRRP